MSDPLATVNAVDKIECGKDAAKHFSFPEGYRNLNHGSFGTFPKELTSTLRHYQDECEARPDWFIRYKYPRSNDSSRAAIAKLINAPVETCVFVPNATTGVNTILRNLVYQPGDVIIYFATIYGSCHKTIQYLTETTPLEAVQVEYTYPCSDATLLSAFQNTIHKIQTAGKRPLAALFDTIVSLPGVRVPFEALTTLCRKHSIFSILDAAHCIGQIPIDLSTLDPDFFVSNCHKWLHVPRGCAVLYVPVRNQHLMRSTLPTSHGFVPREGTALVSPLPPTSKSEFVNNFEFVGTVDNSPYLCLPAALAWRSKVVYGDLRGEEAIMRYGEDLALRGGDLVAAALGTEVMQNAEGTLRGCHFANVRLPVRVQSEAAEMVKIAQWISQTLVDEYDTFMAILVHGSKLWVRLSAQVYLTEEDFVWAGRALREVCERVGKGEWRGDGHGKAKL
ncbi:hypothetical protein M409DRAFT_69998 [Zasmidium cellare ATCC 36951]|uniref:Aminotransferase class V domain-containing protein n=1 Tax=Zasmidium cellare ATCC 36951 TaxID=1080233 RepID=A0A6A6C2K0_ZASCE|nr:uncharacterized protein M409DRAFT_69998 [Zasmidium cellare ATCC 36951]KAF2161163.1 hypothetical protein M409DRAFT_69998 [Zasmidium cellare ATCC 36951]